MKTKYWIGAVAVTAAAAVGVGLVAHHEVAEARGYGDGYGQSGGYGGGYGREAYRDEADGPRRGMRERWGRYGHGHGHHRRRGRGARLEDLFKRADTDGDGAVSKAELDAAREARFKEMDTDGSGKVSAEEIVAWRMKRRAERWIARRDADGDGELSLDETPNRTDRIMRFDLDENGVVTRTELRLARPGVFRRPPPLDRAPTPAPETETAPVPEAETAPAPLDE